MTCDFCGGKTVTRRVKKHDLYQGRLFIVENVAAEVCPECGERYYHARILDGIDALLRGKPKAKKTLKVAVVSM